MPGTQQFFNGNMASFGINGTDLVGNDGWSIEASPNEIRTDNTAGAGYSDRILGSRDLVATIDMSWDASANPLDSPIGFAEGTILTNVKLYLNGATSPFYLLPKAIVTKNTVAAKVNEKVSITIPIANKGTFTRPTGTFTPNAATV